MRQKGRLGRWWTKWMLRHADRVVACSQGLLEDILRFEPRCAPRSAVIYNAIDIEAFQDTAEWTYQIPEQLRARPFLLNIARFEYKKGHDVLIRAFERVASHTADLQLVMIGGAVGDESAAVRQLAEASPCRDRILMLENMPHQRVPIFLRAALLFVLASRREGFPFVLLEAGAFRKPVVATSCIGVPELIEDGVTGRLAPVDDDVALAQSIEDLLEDEVKRNGLAENLHRRVQEEFNWPVVVKQHLAL
jgi:starch synthase